MMKWFNPGAWAMRALLACLCVVTTPAVSFPGALAVKASHAPGDVVVQQMSRGAAPASHRSCPRSLPRNAGGCVSPGFVGLDEPVASHAATIASRSSRLTIAIALAVAQQHGSRLERPPRT